MSILFVNASPNPRGTTARLAAQLLAGKSYDTIELGTTKVYDYGQDFDDDRFDEVADAMRAAALRRGRSRSSTSTPMRRRPQIRGKPTRGSSSSRASRVHRPPS